MSKYWLYLEPEEEAVKEEFINKYGLEAFDCFFGDDEYFSNRVDDAKEYISDPKALHRLFIELNDRSLKRVEELEAEIKRNKTMIESHYRITSEANKMWQGLVERDKQKWSEFLGDKPQIKSKISKI